MTYDLFEHRNRFAIWAAARAAQRGLAAVDVFRDCFDATDLRGFASRRASLRTGAAAFEALHRRWCSTILKALRRYGLENAAAKFVAVYLKCMIVVGPDAGSRLSAVIHPPIDRILLKNVTSSRVIPSRMGRWRGTSWTSLDQSAYYALIADLRTILRRGEPFWKLEEHWTITRRV
jgi:hypothetical protein